ncbi:hypothetical protein PanWU01x14_370530 [Parasponia andersonii]|uniref:Uncharacterized protein n=1 Tax=Parasponia andersonii TaxID=3476 RepID=A0A2P5A495_PARAD|nr:hypothetical protein PanWU01x14_370530 [Parasponia andersonii]
MSKKRPTIYAAFKEKAQEITNAEEYFLTRVKEGTITPMVGASGESGKKGKRKREPTDHNIKRASKTSHLLATLYNISA